MCFEKYILYDILGTISMCISSFVTNYNYKYCPRLKKTRQVKKKLGMIIVILKSYLYTYLTDCEYKNFSHTQ